MASNGVGPRLDSWKEIAAYLKRDSRTAQRWERDRALPVHRVPGTKRAAVFADVSELEAWLRQQPVAGLGAGCGQGGDAMHSHDDAATKPMSPWLLETANEIIDLWIAYLHGNGELPDCHSVADVIQRNLAPVGTWSVASHKSSKQ